MAERVHAPKPTARREQAESDETAERDAAGEASAKGGELVDALDSLLDEIDEVLEENAQEFVASYIQRGGQ